MGIKFKLKAPKAISKIATGAVKNAVLLTKDPKKALGNYTNTMTNVLTLGQGKTIDAFTGGGFSSFQGAFRGNTKDIARVGLTAGAAALTGGSGAFLVNKAFASGASPLEAGLAGATGIEEGSSMSWLKELGDIANSPAVSGLVGARRKPSPAPAQESSAPQIVYAAPAPAPKQMDNKTKYMIGGGIAAFLFLLFYGKNKR